MPSSRSTLPAVLVLPLLVCAAPPLGAASGELTRFTFLGEAVVPSEPPPEIEEQTHAPVGGLSALLYRPETGDYLAVSDDGARRGPARFYTLEIDAEHPVLAPDGARVAGATEILDSEGQGFRPHTVDPEGLAPAPDGGLFVSSEGRSNRGVAPFVRRYGRDGRMRGEVPLPARYLPAEGSGDPRGVRNNQGFESLTTSPDGRFLFAAVENALAQDGPEATVAAGSPARLLRWEVDGDRPAGVAEGSLVEWTYPVDPVALPPRTPDATTVAGLVELLGLGPETLLALERSFTEEVGMAVKLYRVSLAEATEVTGRESLREDLAHGDVRPAAKTLLLDLTEVLADLEIPLDNLEGMTFGPRLPDGRRSLLLLSDDNFASPRGTQRTQVLAFAVSDEPVSVAAIQGRTHRSPFEGEWVREVRGVVTALDPQEEPDGGERRIWVQSPPGATDDDPATSDGLAVRLRADETAPLPGSEIALSGRVAERGFPGALTVTTLVGGRARGLGEAPVPAPVVLGAGGRPLPTETIDDDGLTSYDPHGPDADGLDAWESLEGMRVTVPEPVVVGPTTRYGGFAVVPDGGAGASLRTCAGGLVARPDDFNPERVLVRTELLDEAPDLQVGARLSAPVTGVVGYDYANYRVLPTAPLPPAVPAPAGAEGSPPPIAAPPEGALTVATYNVLNLHPGSGAERFRRLATDLVVDLGAPDLVALQEIQDVSGPKDDGLVAGGPTFDRLIAAIEEIGGPTYDYRQVDPVDGTEGGQPGGNIRVGFLVRPDRLEVVGLPRRVAPDHPCFTGAGPDREPTRRSLALEVRFGPRTLIVVNNHWKSKRGDDRLFGATQPPVLHTEAQRTCQARVIADFVEELLADEPDAWVIVAGDLNEHEFRPPLAELEAVGLTNLMERIPRADRYTYNFEGNSQVLDHLLVSPAVLREAVVRASIAHVNADAPDAQAASDHDPVLATLLPRGETDATPTP